MAKVANVQERIDHWKGEEGYTHSQILHQGLTYSRATELEKQEADHRHCKYYPGGDSDNDSDWCVYHVWK